MARIALAVWQLEFVVTIDTECHGLLPPVPDVLPDAPVRCFFHMSETAAGLGTAPVTRTASMAFAHTQSLPVMSSEIVPCQRFRVWDLSYRSAHLHPRDLLNASTHAASIPVIN